MIHALMAVMLAVGLMGGLSMVAGALIDATGLHPVAAAPLVVIPALYILFLISVWLDPDRRRGPRRKMSVRDHSLEMSRLEQRLVNAARDSRHQNH